MFYIVFTCFDLNNWNNDFYLNNDFDFNNNFICFNLRMIGRMSLKQFFMCTLK